ncbi:MAG: aminotransferase class V-fold PLP-dependent enzyme [Planctomycetia bacterium]|nr:aminotransferase class V-fold PLP-dependent enzyme [Planctomycetia bacterium]
MMMTDQTVARPIVKPIPNPWEAFRRQMRVGKRWAYFDHAAVAPLSGPALDALEAWARDAAENGDVHWPLWAKRLENVRRQSAKLLHADVDEVALIRNTTEGVNLVAEGFPWKAGDNIVTLGDEFPTNRIPWQNLAARGVETRLVSPAGPSEEIDADLDRLLAACDSRTRIVSVSWVGYASGRRFDVGKLAEAVHSRGALLFLDAIQGLGVFPLDVHATEVDFLAADGHKWLLGPEGAGLFYVRRDLLNVLRPIGIGWNSIVDGHDFAHVEWQLKPTAARYEGGTMNTGGFIALGASLALLAAYDTPTGSIPASTAGGAINAIGRRVLELTESACRRLREVRAVVLSDRRPSAASGIVSFELPGKNPIGVRRHLLDHGVVVSCRAGKLRISPHAYNNDEDLERLIAALRSAE